MIPWTDELSERVARDRYVTPEATWLAWLCVTLGPLVVAGVIGILVRWF